MSRRSINLLVLLAALSLVGYLIYSKSHYSSSDAVALSGVLFFYWAGQTEKVPTAVWAVLSALISFVVIKFTSWGDWGVIGGQVLLFVAITFLRLGREGDAANE